MESMVYQFDKVSQKTYLATAGTWSSDSNGPYYYTIIPLEIGKAYKVTLQNVTTLARFRVVQSDSNVIGSATLSIEDINDSPQDGYSILVFAKKDYLICYGGTANGGEVLVTSVAIEDKSIIGTWTVKENVTNFRGEVRINCRGTYWYRYDGVNPYWRERSISYIGTPNSTYMQTYFAVAESSYGVAFDGSKLWFTTNEFYSASGLNQSNAKTEYLTFVIESVDADAGSEEYQIILTWLNVNATKQSEEPTATVITYNGSTIATLEAGQTATIKAAEYEFDHDLVFKVASGGGSGGSAEFNIAYGDTAPTDTSKLWVKASEPAAVSVTSAIVTASEELEFDIAHLPTAASGIAPAVVGTKVYLFGGAGGNTINVFDTESKTIETLSTKLPAAASGITSAVVGTKVYLFGGFSGGFFNTINVFDTESKTIETLSTKLPAAAYNITSAVVGTKVYLFGGEGDKYLRTINVFDTESKTIATLSTPLATTMAAISSAVVGTKVYLFGGRVGYNSFISSIYVFDTESNTIAQVSANLDTAASGITSAVVGTKVYLFGGCAKDQYLSQVYVFDTENETRTTLSTKLPTAAEAIASAVVGTKVYLFGGYGGVSLNTINVFTVLMPLASNNMIIEADKAKNRFNLLPNVELGVNAVYLGNAEGNGEKVEAYLHNGTEWVEI